jgi:hypothetical protein
MGSVYKKNIELIKEGRFPDPITTAARRMASRA